MFAGRFYERIIKCFVKQTELNCPEPRTDFCYFQVDQSQSPTAAWEIRDGLIVIRSLNNLHLPVLNIENLELGMETSSDIGICSWNFNNWDEKPLVSSLQ